MITINGDLPWNHNKWVVEMFHIKRAITLNSDYWESFNLAASGINGENVRLDKSFK
jgi:hypothetical protein